LIARTLRVLATVNLDNEFLLATYEIRVVRANRLLADELEAAELSVAEPVPQLPLGIRTVPPELPCAAMRLKIDLSAPHPAPLPASGARENNEIRPKVGRRRFR
jgi:hypothetical protein